VQHWSIFPFTEKKDMEKVKTNEFLTRKEVSEKLRVSYPTLKRWRDKNLISCYKIGFIVRYKRSDIEQLLETSHISNSKKITNEN
jgi:excisionase family DNA binding protein